MIRPNLISQLVDGALRFLREFCLFIKNHLDKNKNNFFEFFNFIGCIFGFKPGLKSKKVLQSWALKIYLEQCVSSKNMIEKGNELVCVLGDSGERWELLMHMVIISSILGKIQHKNYVLYYLYVHFFRNLLKENLFFLITIPFHLKESF